MTTRRYSSRVMWISWVASTPCLPPIFPLPTLWMCYLISMQMHCISVCRISPHLPHNHHHPHHHHPLPDCLALIWPGRFPCTTVYLPTLSPCGEITFVWNLNLCTDAPAITVFPKQLSRTKTSIPRSTKPQPRTYSAAPMRSRYDASEVWTPRCSVTHSQPHPMIVVCDIFDNDCVIRLEN